MAEQQEDVQQAQEEEEDKNKPEYKAPAQKSVKEIIEADKDDESLQKYKQTLLGGDSGFQELFPGKSNCILRKMLIKMEGRKDLEIDLQDEKQLSGTKLEVKEGVEYQICIQFNVQKEILAGLKLINKVSRKGINVDTDKFMVGSYAPNKTIDEIHEYKGAKDKFPHGMLARGEYKVNSLFTDDDKTEHCKWEWSFKIKKDWSD